VTRTRICRWVSAFPFIMPVVGGARTFWLKEAAFLAAVGRGSGVVILSLSCKPAWCVPFLNRSRWFRASNCRSPYWHFPA
jgi:hypothetical protein